jgi:hypothetical protein
MTQQNQGIVKAIEWLRATGQPIIAAKMGRELSVRGSLQKQHS